MAIQKLDPWMIEEARMKQWRRRQAFWEAVGAYAVVAIVAVVLAGIYLVATAHAEEISIVDVPSVYATVTAYSSSVDETDDTPFLTAAGTEARAGVAACPRQYAFGTRVLIEGGEYVCEDRLAQKFDDRFDVWQASKAEAFAFGRKYTNVAILP